MGRRGIHRSIQDYISKLKRNNHTTTTTSNTSRLLSACKHPKTSSFAAGRDEILGRAATLSDVDRFLFDNFNSLYTLDDDLHDHDHDHNHNHDSIGSPEYYSADVTLQIKATERFFVSPGTSSGSLMEEVQESASSSSSSSVGPTDDSLAVMTLSKDPYEDFRLSMEEMVEARQSGPLDWEFMEDLLFCYLELNDRGVHKYILGAFADVVASRRRRWRTTVEGGGNDVVSPSPTCR